MRKSLKLALTILVLMLAVAFLSHFLDWMNLPSDSWFWGGVVGALLLLLLVIGVVIVLNIVRMTRIGPGYIGIEINLAGSQRGAQEIPIRTGWVFYSPLKTQIVEYPTFVQTVKWTGDVNEGHPLNEE